VGSAGARPGQSDSASLVVDENAAVSEGWFSGIAMASYSHGSHHRSGGPDRAAQAAPGRAWPASWYQGGHLGLRGWRAAHFCGPNGSAGRGERGARRSGVQVVVPTTVRVEAGWDRTSVAWAFPNRLRIIDVQLDQTHGNAAAAFRRRSGVSAAEAHLGAVIRSTSATQVTVVTGDPEAIQLIVEGRVITIVAI
jgi:hypothetical protein